ncbi:PLP-dependent lyase/thiolase [Candidatus Saccharibacteria bacterium]|nr:PLP-dependent lyase/thiolase [Candidatus Saccharibacteria bacterium]
MTTKSTIFSRPKLYEKLATEIGTTPLLEQQPLEDVWTKFESANPSGSHYDRAYCENIAALEIAGAIRPGDELRDISSGSAGISLSYLASRLEYNARILVPSELPEARVKPMRDLGAQAICTGSGYVEQASKVQLDDMLRFKGDPNYTRIFFDRATTGMKAVIFENNENGKRVCFLNHSENPATVDAFTTIAHEIIDEAPRPFDAVALALGNGTTICGIAPVLKHAWPDTTIIGYTGRRDEPIENFGTATVNTDVPLTYQKPALDLLDQLVEVGADARDTMHSRINNDLPREQQMGRSSLLGLVTAAKYQEEHPGSLVLTIGYDTMNRY